MNRTHTPVGAQPPAQSRADEPRAADDDVAIRARLIELEAETLERIRRTSLPD